MRIYLFANSPCPGDDLPEDEGEGVDVGGLEGGEAGHVHGLGQQLRSHVPPGTNPAQQTSLVKSLFFTKNNLG